MPIKNPFKKTFKQKRKSLGVRREYNDTRTRIIGGLKANDGQANPKIKKTESNFKKEKEQLKSKYNKLLDFKPRNEMQARKKEEALKPLKAKLESLDKIKENKIETIETKRKLDREKRQANIIYNKLLDILDEKQRSALISKGGFFGVSFDAKLLRQKYKDLITKKNRNLTFKDITSKQAYALLDSVIIKKK